MFTHTRFFGFFSLFQEFFYFSKLQVSDKNYENCFETGILTNWG